MTKPVIVTRSTKGSALTWTEGDSNFTNLQNATFGFTDGVTTINNDLNSAMTLVAGANITLTLNSSTNTLQLDSTAADTRIQVYNNTGSIIPKGSVLRVVGAQGNNPSVALAQANGETTSASTIGFAYQDIPISDTGYMQTAGTLKGLNTSTYTEGDAIYLSPTTAGGYTHTKPSAPNHLVVLGWVTRTHASAGQILIHIDNGWEIGELHNVSDSTPNNADVLTYNSSTGIWYPFANNYALPTASTSTLGGVKIDGTTITINGSGVITSNTSYTLPTSTTTVLGGVKIDGTSITISNGVISATGGGSGGASETFNPLFLLGV